MRVQLNRQEWHYFLNSHNREEGNQSNGGTGGSLMASGRCRWLARFLMLAAEQPAGPRRQWRRRVAG